MKRANGTFCDKCQDQITDAQERRGEALHYGKTDYHVWCYCTYRRERRPLIAIDETHAVVLIIALMWCISAFAPEDLEAQHSTFIDMTCKGATAQTEHGATQAGIRCDAKGLVDTFRPRWTAWNARDPTKPSFTSTQPGFFFPAGEDWMVIDLLVETPIDTVYLPRVKARRINGKPELAIYEAER